MARIAIIAGLILVIGFMSYEDYKLFAEKKEVQKDYSELERRLGNLEAENLKASNDIKYYSDEANLEKEARAQLNYKSPDEKMIIVIPKQ